MHTLKKKKRSSQGFFWRLFKACCRFNKAPVSMWSCACGSALSVHWLTFLSSYTILQTASKNRGTTIYVTGERKRWPPSTCALRRCVRDLWCPLPVVGEVSTLTGSALWIPLSNPPMTSDLCRDSEACSWGVLIPFRVVDRRWALRLLAAQPEKWTVPRSDFESWMWTQPKRKSIHLVHWLLTTLLTYLFTWTQTIRIKEWWDKNASCKHVNSKCLIF